MVKKRAAPTGRTPKRLPRLNALASSVSTAGPCLYTLDVFLIGGPVTKVFARKNRVVCRTIRIRGDQTLQDLRNAIFHAFGRWEQHTYEFQFGKGPMDPEADRYVLPSVFGGPLAEEKPPAGSVTDTTLDALELKVGDRFGYWFDFGQSDQAAGEMPAAVRRGRR
jgi:hypothetical protein